MPSFSDYYANNLGAAPTKPVAHKIKSVKLDSATPKKGNQLDPLSWITDILSRPLYGVTNIVHDTINGMGQVASGIKQGNEAGAVGKVLGENPLGPVGSFLSGVFSTNPDAHHTTSDLIEQGTDFVGQTAHPDTYKDTPNNVNPWVKGIAGFAGDVALDPLTYVPGAAFVSVGKKLGMVSKADKTVAKILADTAPKTADDVSKEAAKVVDTVAKPHVPTATDAITATSAKLDNAAAVLNPEVPRAGSVIDTLAKPEADVTDFINKARLAGSDAKVAKALKTPKAEQLRTALKDVTNPEVASLSKAVLDSAKTKPLTYPEWLTEAKQAVATFPGKLSELPKAKLGGKPVSLAVVLQAADSGDTEAIRALRTMHSRSYLPAYVVSARKGTMIDAIGRKVEPAAPVAQGATETVSRAVEAFQHNLQTADGEVRAQLGDGLVDNLSRYTNPDHPDHFDKVLKGMHDILDGSTDVHTLKKLTGPNRALLKELGLEPSEIPLGLRKVQRVPNVVKPTPYVSDLPPEPLSDATRALVDKMGEGSLTESQHIADDVLRDTIKREFVDARDPAIYIDRTKRDALRTATEYGAGNALWEREFNEYSVYTTLASLRTRVSKMVAKMGGRARAMAYSSKYLSALNLVERKLDQLGVPVHIGVKDEKVLLYPSQILGHMNQLDRKAMDWGWWNGGTAAPETNVMDAVVAAVGGKVTLADGITVSGPEGIRAALRQTSTKYSYKGQVTHFDNKLARINQDGRSMGPGTLGKEKLTGDELVEQMANLIERAAPGLRAAAEDNAKAWMERTGAEVHDLTDQTLNHLNEVFSTATGQGDLIRGIDELPRLISTEGTDIGATQKAVDLTGAAVEGTVDPIVRTTVTSYVKTADKLERAEKAVATATKLDTKALSRIRAEGAQERTDAILAELARSQKFDPAGATRDFGEDIAQRINEGFLGKVRTVFDRSYGNENLHEFWRRAESVWHTSGAAYAKNLSNIQRKLGLKEDMEAAQQAYYHLQHGLAAPNDRVAAIMKDLESPVGQLFGTAAQGSRGLLDSAFAREGIDIDHANSIMEHYGLSEYIFDVSKAKKVAAEKNISMSEALAQQWREHDVQDPLAYLNKMYTAFSKAAADQLLVNDFVNWAHKLGAISLTPRQGFKRVLDNEGGSILAHYLPTEAYFHDEALRQLHVIDTLMRNPLKKQGPIWDFINNYYVPLLDMWKWGNTLPNPSHHARNFVGDTTLTMMANGSKGLRTASRKAMQAMATHNAYDGYDAVAALQGIRQLPSAGRVLSEGRLGKLTANDFYEAAAERGNLPTFQVLEQLETHLTGTALPARSWEKLTGTKGAQVIGGISEARDHYVRLVHFIQYVDQRISSTKFHSLNDLLDEAAKETRKWHPDGSDLTNPERVFKLAIPFYSWMRKAIPLVVESLITHPQRVNAFNKASYNLAVATGVNPYSLSDPFPTDQMFPSYLTDQDFGPQFEVNNKYFGISPGIAPWDVLDSTIAGNPLQNVMGQTTPIIKAPFEIATGHSAGTGGTIHDWSDYLDSQIPGVAQGARLSGVSPTGSIVSLLQGKGLDPQYQVAQGNKNPLTSVVNYLTGLGLTPMSAKNTVSFAQFEKLNAAKASPSGF